MPWQGWVLLSGILTGGAQFLGKRQVKYTSALQAGMIKDLSMWVVVLIIAGVTGKGWAGWQSVLAMLNGAVVAVGIASYYVAVRESLSGTSVFGYLVSQIMLIVAAAIVFGEWRYFDMSRVEGRVNLAVTLGAMAMMWMYRGGGQLSSVWSRYLGLSIVLNVIGNLVMKWLVAGGMPVVAYQTGEATGLVIGGAMAMLLKGQNLRVEPKGWLVGMGQGLLTAGSIFCYTWVLVQNPLSIASLIRRMGVMLVTVGGGLWWYREKEGMSMSRYIVLGLAIAGFVVLSWLNR